MIRRLLRSASIASALTSAAIAVDRARRLELLRLRLALSVAGLEIERLRARVAELEPGLDAHERATLRRWLRLSLARGGDQGEPGATICRAVGKVLR